MNSELSEALQASIQRELAAKGYSAENDSVMAEYVTIMLINSKTPSQITAELSELIGEDYDPSFTDWLFKEKDRLDAKQSAPENVKPTSLVQVPTSPIPTFTSQEDALTTRTSRQQRPLIQQALSSLPSTQKRTASMRSPSPSSRPAQKKRLHELPDRPKAMREESNQPRRSLLDRVGGKAPGHDRMDKIQPSSNVNFAPAAPSFGGPQGMPTDQAAAISMMQMGGFNPLLNGFNPSGPPVDPMVALSQLGLAALQLGLVQVPGMTGNGPIPPSSSPSKLPQDTSHVRPAHRGRAQYVAPHLQNPPTPESPSTLSPAPKPRETPSAPPRPLSPSLCKFGVNCTNPSCKWSHPSPVATVESGIVLSADPCPEGLDCKNKDCTLSHVSKAWKPSATLATAAASAGGKPSTTPSLIVCKFGVNCTRPNCPYFHPRGQQFSGPSPSSIPCKFGAGCTRAECPYKHPKDRVLPSQFSRGLDPAPPTSINAPGETKNRSVDFRSKPLSLDPTAKEFIPGAPLVSDSNAAATAKDDSVKVDA